MDHTWIFDVAIRIIMQYETSLHKYPNIKTGEDFKGYDRLAAA